MIEHNVVERGGKILKHVSGVGLRAASWSVVRHNRIVDMPRYAMDADTIIPNEIAIGNTFEHNIMDGSSLETSDTGAMEFTGQGAMFKLGWDMNTTIRYNNISRVMGAEMLVPSLPHLPGRPAPAAGTVSRKLSLWCCGSH